MKHMLYLLLLLSSLAFGQSGQGIPTKYMNDPAVDLVRGGKALTPDEVHQLREDSKGRFDISTLDPAEGSDLWKNTMLKALPEDKNPVIDMDEVHYHSPVLTSSGIFRFNIQNKNGDGRLYTMMLSKTVHSILLAKNVLRKIGYQIPDIKYLPRVVVKFKNEQEKKGFISYLTNVAMAGAAKSWVVEDLDTDKLLLQDLVIMDSNHTIYNLAVGVTSDMIQGRRLLSSLSVPLTLVNLTESVNMLRWNACHINNNEVVLYHDQLQNFQTSWDDARWITRRLERLTREDWKEIVEGAYFPKAVQQILVEKLISRRNSVMKCLKVDAEQMKIDSEISNGVELYKGKLTQQDWPGYSSRFAFGDPESPLSDSEMKSWIKSRVISTAMELALGQINQLPWLGTDINKINNEKFQENMKGAIAKSIATKTPIEVPLKAWVFPTFRGQIIMARNLVTGTYLGTDNLVQLVDTVGLALGGGVFAGTMGLPSPLKAYGNAEAIILRTYAHLRPVTSIQKSLKYPFKNILVPLVKRDYGQKLHEAAMVSIDPAASDKEKAEKIEAALKPFKDSMEVGESILITDSVATQAGVQVSGGLDKLLDLDLSIVPGHKLVSRFHVHRKTADIFHLYRDIGNEGSLTVSMGLDSLIPVLSLSLGKSKGQARVKFYALNLSPKASGVIENISHLRRAIVSNTTGELDEKPETKPFVVRTRYKESTPTFKFLFWQWKGQKSASEITVTNPKGDERYFTRDYHGTTQGKNYQAYVNEVIAHWVKLIFNKKSGLSDATGANPGYSFKGSAKNRTLTLDQEVDKNGQVIEPFVRISRVYNGWSIDRKKAEEILEEMKTKYRYEFYSGPVLNDTRRIFMYNINLDLLFYKRGISYMLGLSDLEIRKIFWENRQVKDLMIARATPFSPETKSKSEQEDDDEFSGAGKFLRFLAKFKKFEEQGNEAKANKYLLKAFSQAENKVNLKGLQLLVGGIENLYLVSRINGYREGDEDGDKALVSNSLGEYGSPQVLGPVVQLQRETDMLEGEFFIYWMMTRLI